MEMERALPFAVDDDGGVAAVLPPPPSGQLRRHQLQDEEDEEAELSDEERDGEDENEDELDDAAYYLLDRRQPGYDVIDEQIHRLMVVGVLIQSLDLDFYTVLTRLLEETNGGGDGGGPASAAAVSDLEKQAFHAIGECAGGGGDVTECAICLQEFEDGEEVSVMPCSRGHQFHTSCITEWLRRSNSCPLCRHALPTATGVDGQ